MRTLKYLAILSIIVGGSIASASKFETRIVAQNVVLWRGLSFSQATNAAGDPIESNNPGIGGGISYLHDSGFSFGTYTMNLQTNFDQEFQHWLAYTFAVGDWSITPAAYRYWFPRAMEYSTYDARVTVNWKTLTLFASYMPEYFYGVDDSGGFVGNGDNDSSDIYMMANYAQPIQENVFVVGELGYTMFDKQKVVGMKNYFHYSLALRHTAADNWSVDLGWSDTDRRIFTANNVTIGDTSKAKDNYTFFRITKVF